MKCKNPKCSKEHDGAFGSGEFCSRACANSRSFSQESKKKKSEVNKKTFKERGSWGRKKGESQSEEQTAKCIQTWNQKILGEKWENLSYGRKRKRVILEQKGKCAKCEAFEWQGSKLTLELDHINGDHNDNSRSNLVAICPNCHSITITWKGRNKLGNKNRYSEKDWYEAYLNSANIRQALLRLGVAAKGDSYERMRIIVNEFNKNQTGHVDENI